MRLAINIFVLLVVLTGIGSMLLYLNYGTVAPCSILRERIRQQAAREGGQFGTFIVTAIPDKVLDGLIAAQYGSLSPGHCINLLIHGVPQQRQPLGAAQ